MLIIGFGNKARHGKDTAGQSVFDYYEKKRQLALRHGLRVIPSVGMYKFATTLYEEVNEAIEHCGGSVSKLIAFGQTEGLIGDDGKFYYMPLSLQPTPNPEMNEQLPYGKHGALLQWWGTEYRRKQDSNYWVRKCMEKIGNDAHHIAVITDVRFINEAEAVRQAGGYTVRVSRKNTDGTPFVSKDRPANHPSEVELDNYNFDYEIIAKEGQVAWLEQQAITLAVLLREIRG